MICTALFSRSLIDSLETELLTADGKARIKILFKLAEQYRNTDPQKSIEFAEEVLPEIDQIENSVNRAIFLNNLGWAYYNIKEFQNALDVTKRALVLSEQIDHQGLISFSLNSLGTIYWGQNNYKKALENHLKALKISETLNDSVNIAKTMNNIGLILFAEDNYDKCLEYYLKALEIQNELGNKLDIAITNQNIAHVYGMLDDYEKTIQYHISSLKLAEEIGYERLVGVILTNMAISYAYMDKIELALEYFDRALTITRRLDDKGNIARALHYIAAINKDKGKYDEAISIEREALEMAQEINDQLQIKYILEELSYMYADLNDFEKAYNNHVRFKEINDSIFNIEKFEQITEMETKYETEKKEQQITLLEKDNTIAGMKIKRQRLLLLYSAIGVVLILAFVLILSNLYRQKTKTAAALAVANGKLEELSRTDPLTKLWNRRYMYEIIERERVRIKRSFEAFSFILMDIDHFKIVNDTYGHECGDYVLSTMAVILRSAVRKQDVVGRWGGEEFLLFLPSTALKGAITIAESIRKKIADYPFSYDSKEIAITSTLGVSEYDETVSVEECIKLADDGLYTGKESGRNRVVSVQVEDKGV